LFVVALGGLLACDEESSGFNPTATSLVGTWDIEGELVTTSAEDPYTPEPGSIAYDQWVITESAGGLKLTTPKGSLDGAATASGASFFAEGPLAAGVIISVQIDCIQKTADSFYGTEEIQYTGVNSVTGALVPLGMEAWKVWGQRK
jgi:hypothetical protein